MKRPAIFFQVAMIFRKCLAFLTGRLFEIGAFLVTVLVVSLVVINPFSATDSSALAGKPTATPVIEAGSYFGDSEVNKPARANSNPAGNASAFDSDIGPGIAVNSPALSRKPVLDISSLPARTAEGLPGNTGVSIDMKVLVLAADGNEEDLPAIQQALEYAGIPYIAVKTAPQPQDPATDRLSPILAAGNHAFYQGIILTTGQLVYKSGNLYPSALNPAEWQALARFEARFNIRQISWYTAPSGDYGFQSNGTGVDTTRNPLNVSFTGKGDLSGKSVFSYVNISNPLAIKNAYTYLARPLEDGLTFPLLVDNTGNALALVRTYPDGRQTLVLTFDSNPNLIHTLVLSYGLVNWVTKGLFVGDYRIYLTAQPDDIFIGNYIWKAGSPCDTKFNGPGFTFFRMTGRDLQTFADWQRAQQAKPITPDFKLELPFVGIGTTGIYNPDTLTPAAMRLMNEFNWVTHTYDHTDLDNMDYAQMGKEIEQNIQIGNFLKILTPSNYSPHSLITPNVSGLKNPAVLRSIYDHNIRFLVSNTSVAGYENPSPNHGIYLNGPYNGKNYNIFLIPRHPTDLYFNVTTPEEWRAEDQCYYTAGDNWHVENYRQLLDRESQIMLLYLLKGDMDPVMFHQPNMRAYDGTHSLLSDLLDATLEKYNRYFTLPVVSNGGHPIPVSDSLCGGDLECPQGPMDRLGYNMANRTNFAAAEVTASLVPGKSLTISARQAITVPVTGVPASASCPSCSPVETYGGQNRIYVTLKAEETITLPLQ